LEYSTSCVRGCLIDGSETWLMTVKQLERREPSVIRWMSQFTLKKCGAQIIILIRTSELGD